jgi:peptidoglycan hydrolase CwlO-like protein
MYQSKTRELEDKNQTISDLKAHIKSVQESKDKQDEDVVSLKALTEKMKKKIEFCKEQMEKGNEHIQ